MSIAVIDQGIDPLEMTPRQPPDDAPVAQHGGGDDRHFLWNWHSQAAEQEHGEDAEVRKVVDELLKCLHGVLRSNGIPPRIFDSRRPQQRSFATMPAVP
jgi:hypothetical protein